MRIFIQFKRITAEFIWGSPVHKIQHNRVVQQYEEGGLKLVDLTAKDKAMKAVAVLRSMVSPGTSPLFHGLPIKNDMIWKCNIAPEDLKTHPLNSYAYQAWKVWASVNFIIPTSTQDVLNQYLWFNHHIRRAGILWSVPAAQRNGPYQIRDINNMLENRFLSYNELILKYGQVMDFVTYASLLRTIPKAWLASLRDRTLGESQDTGQEVVPKNLKLSQYVYWAEINKMNKGYARTTKMQWEHELSIQITDSVWSDILSFPFDSVSATKLRYFQFKVSNKYLSTNVKVAKWNRDVHPHCSFGCGIPETMIHLLWNVLLYKEFGKHYPPG